MKRTPHWVTDAAAVRLAIDECNKMGREAFRDHYGYGEARSYFIRYEGKTYDSKAIVGVAFGYQHTTKPLLYNDFSGGAATVKPILEKLGFAVVASDLDDDPPPFRSEWLEIGEVYTRENLREIYDIVDATLNNGVFKPKGSRSIWLFVTKEKTADRPQLVDSLDGDVLTWDGQPAGRTDRILIDHLSNGDEVLLFYREKRTQFPQGGFRYEGPFLYRSHKGSKPTKFVFDRDPTAELSGSAGAVNPEKEFDPRNIADGRAQVLALVRRRQGQPKFRADLLKAYEGKCAITGCDFLPLLEAAHIYPYRGEATNDVSNGLLLRADLHTLFDLGLIAVKPDFTLDICETLAGTEYSKLASVRLPKRGKPSAEALTWHRETIASKEARDTLRLRVEALVNEPLAGSRG